MMYVSRSGPHSRVMATAACVVSLLALPLALGGCEPMDPPSPDPTPAPSTRPARVLRLSGELRAHDPTLIRNGDAGDGFVFSTGDPRVRGGTVQIRRSRDLRTWTYAGNVFDAIPGWVSEAIPGVANLWAPEVFERAGTYYLYYSASTFGSNRSLIGLATNTTLDPLAPGYRWVDRGLVVESFRENDFNAIDPFVIEETGGNAFLAFGSFFSGIRMLRLTFPSGKLAPGQGAPLRIADRFVPPNAIEAPAILERDGAYFLFVSLDFCCRGVDSTYKIAVGRADRVTGPYVDRAGVPLQGGGGTVLLSGRGSTIGPGGQSVTVRDGLLVHHFYDGNAGGDFRLSIREIGWDAQGWPVLDGPQE